MRSSLFFCFQICSYCVTCQNGTSRLATRLLTPPYALLTRRSRFPPSYRSHLIIEGSFSYHLVNLAKDRLSGLNVSVIADSDHRLPTSLLDLQREIFQRFFASSWRNQISLPFPLFHWATLFHSDHLGTHSAMGHQPWILNPQSSILPFPLFHWDHLGTHSAIWQSWIWIWDHFSFI